MLVLLAALVCVASVHAVDVQTLWDFKPSKHGNGGAGNWWGPTFATTNNGQLYFTLIITV